MQLETFVKKPVWAATLAIFILIMGVVGYNTLPVRLFPLVPDSEVTVTTTFPGASPDTMAGFVSMPIQQALAGLDGVNYISATNTEGSSIVTVKFYLKRHAIDKALPQITDRISSIMWELPKGINSPIITKVNPNSGPAGDILFYAFYSKTMTRNQITDYLTRIVKSRVESIPGVSDSTIYGERQYAMRIWLDPRKMAAHNVTAADVTKALTTENLQSTSGQLKGKYLQFNVRTNTNLNSAKQFNNIIIHSKGNKIVRIKDIGSVTLGASQNNVNAYILGKPAVVLGILAQDTADSIAVSDRLHVFFNHLKAELPPGLHMQLLADMTNFNKQSIKEVRSTIVEAAIFVFIVILLFLGSLRAVAIPVITIPLSLLGGCGLMWLFGFSANTLTMLAWVLAIGLVVDDAIVVLENIHRHMEEGAKRIDAAIASIHEIKTAIVVMTLTVAVVFIPIGFMPGLAGALFSQFAYTLSMVVLISGILALVVTPVMCTYILPATGRMSRMTKWADQGFQLIRHTYQHLLSALLGMRWLLGIVFAALLIIGYILYHQTAQELIPAENTGVIIGVGFGPPGANIDYLSKYSPAFETIYRSIPEMKNYGIFNGWPVDKQITSFVVLNNEGMRKETRILTKVQEKMSHVKGLFAFAVRRPVLPGEQTTSPLNFVLKTTDNYDALNNAMQQLLAYAQKNPSIIAPMVNLKLQSTQINVDINREKANALGVSTQAINDALAVYFGKPIINRFNLDGRSYEVIPQVYRHNRYNPEDIKKAFVRTKSGQLVQLSTIAAISEQVAPNALNQFQQMRSATLSAALASGYTQGEALAYLEGFVNHHLPKSYTYDTSGPSREFVQSQGILAIAFAFAIILIYLLLCVFFNSFREPFIVMLSVPLAMVGAMYTMYLTGDTLNIYTKIGLIMLVGLVSKHGILIVYFANKAQFEHKLKPFEAVIEAASIRLRPILMTTAAMIAGAIPLVLSQGAGHLARQNIGWVIVGGMALGTCLTLFIVPAAYTLLAKDFNIKH